MYNSIMSAYRFICPVQVRYGDLDSQWHVNNARFLSYLEQARMAYLIQLDLFDGKSFFDIGIIVADIHIRYIAPILISHDVQVATRISRLGTKSMVFEYEIQDKNSGQLLAKAESVMVAYNYHQQQTRPIPPAWRERISAFEGIPAGPTAA